MCMLHTIVQPSRQFIIANYPLLLLCTRKLAWFSLSQTGSGESRDMYIFIQTPIFHVWQIFIGGKS
jgi:hypothetical protein